MSTFTGAELGIQSVTALNSVTVRVRFTTDPLAVSAASSTDALNPDNYSIAGDGPATISSISTVPGDPQSVDIYFASALVAGTWTVTVSNIETATGDTLTGETVSSFTITSTSAQSELGRGTRNDDAEALVKKNLPPLFKNKRGWNALVAALAAGDAYVNEQAQLAQNQLFKSTASGKYLDRKAANDGVVRKAEIGLSDETFRKLAIKTTAQKAVMPILLDVLETFYGSDSTRAHITTEAYAPFSLQDEDELIIQLDGGNEITITFHQEDFTQIGVASASEVAATITRDLRKFGTTAFAKEYVDPLTGRSHVKIYSGTIGLRGTVRIWGGKAQNTLEFPTELNTTQAAGTTWAISSQPNGLMRFTWSGGTDPGLIEVVTGNYANIFGTVFAEENRGSFKITSSTTTYFEVLNPTGEEETVEQVTASDIRFFESQRQTIQNSVRMATAVQHSPKQIDIILPATTEAISRSVGTGAYLPDPEILDITNVVRSANGGVTVTTNQEHGLAEGNWVILDGVYGDMTVPISDEWTEVGDVDYFSVFEKARLVKLNEESAILIGDNPVYALLFSRGDSSWTPLTTLYTRSKHTATLLENGKVLVAGGASVGDTAELYNPSDQIFTETGNLAFPHEDHTATLLDDGRVLVVGGTPGSPSAEIYDPATGLWSQPTLPTFERSGHTATKLRDGRVVIAGGHSGGSEVVEAEIYNPRNDTWKTVGSLGTGRFDHTAELVSLGTSDYVMVIGGSDSSGIAISSCEFFNPATATWSSTFHNRNTGTVENIAELNTATWKHASVKLQDGRIFVCGGIAAGVAVDRVEIFDPKTNTWELLDSMLDTQSAHEIALFDDGAILVAGSTSGALPELYAPATEVMVAGGLNKPVRIREVASVNSFVIDTPDHTFVTSLEANSEATATVVKHADSEIAGPFIWAPDNSTNISATSSSLAQDLESGVGYKRLTLADASEFPDSGYVVLGFGTDNESGVIKYSLKISNTEILLDTVFVPEEDLGTGTDVTVVIERSGGVPTDPVSVGSFYLTASNAGRLAASEMIDSVVAAGITANKTVVYPGDKGLGGAGLPASGAQKLSDKVRVWGGDDNLDEEIEGLREE